MDSRSHHVRDTTPGTCLWVFDSPIYDEFLNNGGLLCVKGKPGSGKSTMLQKIITKFQHDSEPAGDVVTSFFFWGSGTELHRSRLGLYRSLLHQLCQTMPQLYSDMTREFLDKQSKRGPVGKAWDWNEKQLCDTLMDYLGRRPLPRRTWIFLDALDEAGEKNARIIAEFLKDLSSAAMRLYKPGGPSLGICFTCRHYPIIRAETDLQMCVEDRNGPDISTHSRKVLSKWGLKSKEVDHLCTFIREKANGVFLWAQLVLKQINKYHLTKTFRQIQHIIEETPPELKQMYGQKLQSIEDKDRAQSLLIFQWICFAQEPLSLNHLRIALLLDSNRPETTFEQCLAADDYIAEDKLLFNVVLDRTRGLAQISSGRCIQLIHQSVKDFLEDNSGELCIGSGTSNLLLFRSCLKFMSFPEYEPSDSAVRLGPMPSSSNPMNSKDKPFDVFTTYATNYWYHHAAAAERGPRFEESIIHELDILSDRKIGDAWSIRYNEFGIGIHFKPNDPLFNFMLFGLRGSISLLHAVAACGLLDVLKIAYGERGVRIEPPEARGPTLLHCAVACRQQDVTEWLLSLEMVDPNKQDSSGEAPLHWLMKPDKLGSNPHPEKAIAILEKFLENPKVDFLVQGRDGSVLHHAAFYGKHDLLRIILKKTNMNISLYDKHDRTPLDLALAKEDKQALEVFVIAGSEKLQHATAKATSECNAGTFGTYLAKDLWNAASTYGMESNSQGVWRGKNGVENTILHLAARMGNKVLCQFLIDLGFKVEVRDKMKREPLHRAAESGHLSLVKLLLDSGADILSRDVYGLSPAHLAIIQGHFDIAQTLACELEKSDHRYITPFFRAVMDGNENVAYKACLDDADRHRNSDEFVSPTLLQMAADTGDFRMAQASATPANLKMAYDETPLGLAIGAGHLEIVRLLLDKGADPFEGKPLHLAAARGHKEMVTVLISCGPDGFINHKSGGLRQTPLHFATADGDEDMVRELVNHGADVKATDKLWRTPLHLAIKNGHENIARQLIKHGADTSAKDKSGRTPEEHAIGSTRRHVRAWLGLEEQS